MLTSFYRRYSATMLWLVVLTFPVLYWKAQSIEANNDIETWLPRESQVRATYERFKTDFGVEEVVLIGLDRQYVDDALSESLCSRIERLPGIRRCWSPARMSAEMREFGVTDEEARKRLTGLCISPDGSLHGLMASLTEVGIKHRAETVADIRREIEYCQLEEHSPVTGAAVIVTELDRLGGTENNTKFFLATLAICLSLLFYWTRNAKLSVSLLGLTLWAIQLTQAIFCLCGGQMNFILGALPIMVMVFTLEASIHVVHYHHLSRSARDPLAECLKLCVKPCIVSMLTTAIGLLAVGVTDILPVTQFGFAAALGAVVAMLTGLIFTPALMIVVPPAQGVHEIGSFNLARACNWLLANPRKIAFVWAVVFVSGTAGVFWISSKMDPLDFLPANHRAIVDLKQIESRLTPLDSIEAVVNFEGTETSFMDRLVIVRGIEKKIRAHKAVQQTVSVATFFPEQLPQDPLALGDLLSRAQGQEQSEFLADGQFLWRISARIRRNSGSFTATVNDLEKLTAGAPVHFTGIAPLLEQAQAEIFDGFWQSFAWAVLVIGAVMAIVLWSPETALLAMVPNLAPLGVVFGLLGWFGIPVDIGMMMTGSIALGISVDGTFHFLMRYRDALETGKSPTHAVRIALLTTGGPIFESIIVSSLGMLALTMSNFAPTGRFGLLMATLLLTTLAGDLILLPVLLCLRTGPDVARKRNPEAQSRPRIHPLSRPKLRISIEEKVA